MIGLYIGDQYIHIEFNPVFSGPSWMNKLLQVRIKNRWYINTGEYGISWSFHAMRIPTLWFKWGDSCYPSPIYHRIRKIKSKLKNYYAHK